jgi:hypothetical protein
MLSVSASERMRPLGKHGKGRTRIEDALEVGAEAVNENGG